MSAAPNGAPVGVGQTTGLGQNYLWDRYPGEIDPSYPAHTGSVGLAGHDCDTSCCTCAPALAYRANEARGGCADAQRNPNYGSTQIHMKPGVGPLDGVTPCQVGLAGAGSGVGVGDIGPTLSPASTGDAPGTMTGTVDPGSIPVAIPASSLPPLPGTTSITPAPGGGSVVTSTTMPAPAPAPTNTGMLLFGLVLLGIGLAGAAYVANEAVQAQGS